MRRVLAWMLGGLLLLLIAAPFALQAGLERGAFNTTLVHALERATGRQVALGRITLALSLPPRITLLDARLANLPGHRQPDFARAGRLEVKLALVPLLQGRIEIRDLLLADAEIWLERDAEGRPNWMLAGGGAAGGGLPLDHVRIEAARLHFPDDAPGPLQIEALDLQRLRDAAALEMQGRIRWREEAVQVKARLNTSMALRATLAGHGFALTAEGQVAHGLGDPGWNLALTAEIASPARLAALLGSTAALPALGPLTGTGRLGPGGALSGLRVRAGASAPWPGLRIIEAALDADALDQPMRLTLQAQRAGRALAAEITLPTPRAAFTASTPMPVTVRLSAGAARLVATGAFTWGNPLGAAPFDVTLTAPALAPLGPLLGFELPALRNVEARGRLTRLDEDALRWDAARLTAEGIAATGALRIGWAGRPALSGNVAFVTLDLDALSPPGPARARGLVIPEMELPIEALRGFDATLDLTADRLTAAGLGWRGFRARTTLETGRLELADFALTTPGGPVSGRLAWDAASTPPRASLVLRSGGAGLDVAAIRRELGAGIGVQGPVEVALDLSARGGTTRALAASLSGAAGFAMVQGRLSHAGMFRIGPDLTRMLLLGRAPPEGVEIRCFALSFAAEDGLLQSEALLLESTAGRITGNLAINLRNETLAAHLRPDLRVLGATMRAPVGIGGTLAAPRVGVEPGLALAQVVGDTVANRLWRSSTVEWLRRDSGDADCPAQLRQARLGRAGREPAPAAAVIPLVPRELQAPVQEVFRGIGGLFGGRR